MRMYNIIKKKRDGQSLSKDEIEFFIHNYVEDNIPDYQVSALLMAIYFQGITDEECALLTTAMANSGDQIDLSSIKGTKVDKHSTGGVGDKVTLIVAPLVASVGVPVAKMSGRGLGHTGGTIDKLESIPGFRTEMTNDEFIKLVNENRIAIIGQTGNLTPADKKIYSLRDVTATVDSLPLIASSIMSKKIASGADAIVLDIKVGAGAFMKNIEEARKLANLMINIGNQVEKKTIAVISDMNQPLGHAVGNALEVKEAVLTLKGQGPKDVTDLSLAIASHMVVLGNKASTIEEARAMLVENLHNEKAIEKFKTLIASQNGNTSIIDQTNLLPQASYQIPVTAQKSGWIKEIEANKIGHAALMLGAGRTEKDSIIDLAVGIVLHKKVGDQVEKGEPLLTIHSNHSSNDQVVNFVINNIHITNEEVSKPTLLHDIITK